MGAVGVRGLGTGSGIMTPTRQVMIPTTKRAPPPMKTGRSFAQAKTFPERIVRRQELAAAAVRTGPRTTIMIPRIKMSDLKFSPARCITWFGVTVRLLDSRLRVLVLAVG
jgi:hypothetical protein